MMLRLTARSWRAKNPQVGEKTFLLVKRAENSKEGGKM